MADATRARVKGQGLLPGYRVFNRWLTARRYLIVPALGFLGTEDVVNRFLNIFGDIKA